jgi:hypothetical protein
MYKATVRKFVQKIKIPSAFENAYDTRIVVLAIYPRYPTPSR